MLLPSASNPPPTLYSVVTSRITHSTSLDSGTSQHHFLSWAAYCRRAVNFQIQYNFSTQMEAASPAWSMCICGPPTYLWGLVLPPPTRGWFWRGWATIPQIDEEAEGPWASWKCRSSAVAAPSSRMCRRGLGMRGSDPRHHGATLLMEKNLSQAFGGPQAPGFPHANSTSLTSWSHVLQKQVKLGWWWLPTWPTSAGWLVPRLGWVSFSSEGSASSWNNQRETTMLFAEKKKKKVSVKCYKEPRTLPGKPGRACTMCESHSHACSLMPPGRSYQSGCFLFFSFLFFYRQKQFIE